MREGKKGGASTPWEPGGLAKRKARVAYIRCAEERGRTWADRKVKPPRSNTLGRKAARNGPSSYLNKERNGGKKER